MDNDQILLKQQDSLGKFISRVCWLCLFLLIGCETTKAPAPVTERTVSPQKTVGVDSVAGEKQVDRYYVVQKGDTFYSIALKHGIDQRELAEWNNITDPTSIKPGQRINLSVPSKQAEPALYALPRQSEMPLIDSGRDFSHGTTSLSGTSTGQDLAIQKVKTYPKALKLPYSEQNMARLQYSVNPAFNQNSSDYSSIGGGSGTRIENAETFIKPNTEKILNVSQEDWIWPTTGAILSSFSSNSKGLKISGQQGQSIVATAAGEVVYSGNGLRGYGNLIIIKHDDALLSAYAHNSKLLVKEGDAVDQGQKIAEMGNTDTDQPQLHFEIRRYGKPVDPLKYLPADSD